MRSNALSTHNHSPALRILLPVLAMVGAPCMADTASAPPEGVPALAPLFGDHAVLQRDKTDPVWGTAGAGDPITVSFHGQTARTTAGADGRWMVKIGPFPASADPADLVVAGKGTLTLHDVVVGEVWICSGQSNMEFIVNDGGGTYQVNNAAAEVAAASYPLIRQIAIERTSAQSPMQAVKNSGWQPALPATVGKFTAVGYFFARDIHLALHVPVGIINSAWGGTPVESWMSDEARNSSPYAASLSDRWAKQRAEWPPERVAAFPATMAAWQKAEADAKEKHTKNFLPWPGFPATESSPVRPGGLFNGMIAPLQPAAIRGILWYQGEANTGHPEEYAELFGGMIRSWRAGFGQGDVPFYFVQLANFGDENELVDRNWARLREAQAQVLSLPETGMAVTADIGDAQNIHPRNKQEVGRRLALVAKAKVYAVLPESSSPAFESATPEGRAIRVRFSHCGTELQSRGGPPESLEVAGADHVFFPAAGAIEVDTLVASSPDVKAPVAVRYAWTNAPKANLYSDTGLPVAPFRSDSW